MKHKWDITHESHESSIASFVTPAVVPNELLIFFVVDLSASGVEERIRFKPAGILETLSVSGVKIGVGVIPCVNLLTSSKL